MSIPALRNVGRLRTKKQIEQVAFGLVREAGSRPARAAAGPRPSYIAG
jgi:hypothetical protein